MTYDSARPPERSWLKWVRVIGLGVVLAGIQVFLLWELVVHPALRELPLLILLTAGCYLLFASVEGFLACRDGGDTRKGIGAGCLIGGIGVLAIAILALVLLVIIIVNAPPPCTERCYLLNLWPVAGFWLVALVVAEGFFAGISCALGGWIGGRLGAKVAGAH